MKSLRFFLLILLSISSILLSAQSPPISSDGTLNLPRPKGKGRIIGAVVNATTGNPIDFSTISLFNANDNNLIDGTISDVDGKFELNNLPDGQYRIELSFLGYETLNKDIKVENEAKVELGVLKLSEAFAILDEIVVKGERSMIEEKVDRTVYNASLDKLSKGGDAADVLRKVPLLQVDLEGNVSLRGNNNIQVLINNKPSTIFAANVADALKMLPANMIDKVEVITSPSAKYDAEGSGGIINIITKKNNLQGHYLNVNTGIGLRGSNLGVNGSFRSGKFGMTLGGFGRAFYNDAETNLTQFTQSGNNINRTEQSSDANDNGLFGRYNLGFDYDIDQSQFLSGGIRYGIRKFSRDELQTTDLFENSVLEYSSLRDISSNRYSGTIDINLDYLKRFKPQQELSISSMYSFTDENSNFISDNLNENQSFINRFKNLDDNINKEVTLQADYITPVSDNQIWEVGAKSIMRMVNSDFSYLHADAEGDFVFDPNRPAGTLDYDQNVAAAYTSYTISTAGNITFKGGLRWEQTVINAAQDGQSVEISDYSNLVPTLNVSKKLDLKTTIKLGYNRRIQRPWLQQLNPNVNLLNGQSIMVGNPTLRPELTDNIEFGMSTMIKKTFLNASIYGRSTNNAINQVRYALEESPGAIITTFENIGKERSIGLDVFANIKLTENFSINGGVNTQYLDLRGQVTDERGQSVTASTNGFTIGGRLMSQMKLKKDWSLQAFSFMRGNRVELQGTSGGFGFYALGVNKEFNEGKGSVGLAVENFASRGWNIESQINAANFSQVSNMLLLNRSVRVNFSYKFGSMKDGMKKKQTKSVSNSDLIEGGENQN